MMINKRPLDSYKQKSILEVSLKLTSGLKMNKKGDYLNILLKSKQTVFSTKDISLLWGEKISSALRVRLGYYVRNKKLIHLYHGYYAKDNNYNKMELATKIYSPSYVSLETVLAEEGLIFQFYQGIFIASYLSREKDVDGQKYNYQRIKSSVLESAKGVSSRDNYYIASKERAFLDTVYVRKNYHFDNLSALDWEEVYQILPIYKNVKMEKRVKKYQKDAQLQQT